MSTPDKIQSVVNEALESLKKKASLSSVEDPTKQGTVAPAYTADDSTKKATGVDGPVGTAGGSSEAIQEPTEQATGQTPPPATKDGNTEDASGTSLTKMASRVVSSMQKAMAELQTGKNSEEGGGQNKTASASTAPAATDTSKKGEEFEIPQDPNYLIKVSHLILGSEKGRQTLSELALEQLGEQQSREMLDSVTQEYDELTKQAAYQAEQENSVSAAIEEILASPDLDKKAKDDFIRGLKVHNAGIERILAETEEALGGEELLKKASTEDQDKVAEFAQQIEAAYVRGSHLAKRAAAMMAGDPGMEGGGMAPEELEAALVELENYAPEEKLAAIQMLIEEGAIPPEVAEELMATLFTPEELAQLGMGGGGEEMGGYGGMDPETEAAMMKAASAIKSVYDEAEQASKKEAETESAKK